MDYDKLIDAEIQAFIRHTATLYPEDAVETSPEAQRQVYEDLCRAYRQPYPEGVGADDRLADGVPVRIYTAGHPTRSVLYLHGGGFVVGSLQTHDDICAEICAQTGYRVVAVDYRLSPEHAHPAAFKDCWTAANWVRSEYGDDIVLAGDSAGGTLAASVAHHARGRMEGIVGLVLIYPALGGDMDQGSYLEHAHAPMLTREDMIYYMAVRHGGPPPQGDVTSEPLQDSDYSGLPPTVIFTADCDPLRDDGRDYRDRSREAGGQVFLINEPGLVHSYLRARHTAAAAGDSFERITVAIEALGQGLWPYE